MDRLIFIDNFNLCPRTEATLLGTECLECEHMKNVEKDFFCTYEDSEDPDDLSVKEIIDILLDVLAAGHTKIKRDEIKRIITEM